MSRWEGWTFNILTIIVSASGAAYFWMKYLMKNDDPFSVVNHPWEPAMLKAHILAAPLLMLALGMMINSHIVKKLKTKNSRSHRVSGIICLVSFALMAASGYLLQVVVLPSRARALVVVHLAAGGLFVGAYLAHQAATLFLRESKGKQTGGSRLTA